MKPCCTNALKLYHRFSPGTWEDQSALLQHVCCCWGWAQECRRVRHFCLFKCWQQMIENLFGNVLTWGGGFNLLIMAEFSKVMAYNMGEDGWEVKKKKSIFPHAWEKYSPSYQAIWATSSCRQVFSCHLSGFGALEVTVCLRGPAFYGGFLLQHATAKPGRSVSSGFPGNGDKRAVAPYFTATCLPASARRVEESQHWG